MIFIRPHYTDDWMPYTQNMLRPCLLALVLAACSPAPHDMAPLARSVLMLKAESGTFGSGVIVECRPARGGGFRVVVLTAAHVIDDGMVSAAGFDRWDLVARHPALDAALLDAWSPVWVPSVPLRAGWAVEGERLTVTGYGLGQLWISDGYACGHDRSSAPICPGDSGGAVTDAQGRLVGIVRSIELMWSPWSGVPEAVWHHCTYTPVSDILEWAAVYIRVR